MLVCVSGLVCWYALCFFIHSLWNCTETVVSGSSSLTDTALTDTALTDTALTDTGRTHSDWEPACSERSMFVDMTRTDSHPCSIVELCNITPLPINSNHKPAMVESPLSEIRFLPPPFLAPHAKLSMNTIVRECCAMNAVIISTLSLLLWH